jgi:hypothetical protein
VGYVLGAVYQIREFPFRFTGKGRHLVGGIIWVLFSIVGVDRNKGDPLGNVFGRDTTKRFTNMNDIRAVIAGKNYNKRFSLGATFPGPDLPMGIRKREIWRKGS